MRGTRYGDFSRLEAERARDYRSALLQQGRVQLDADANVGVELARDELEVSLRDLLGEGWGPAGDPGFRIEAVAPLAFEGDNALALAEGAVARTLTPHAGRPQTIELRLTWTGGAGIVLDAVDRDGDPACYRLKVTHDGFLVLELAGEEPVVLRASAPLLAGEETQVAVLFDEGHATLLTGYRQLARGALRTADSLQSKRTANALVLGGSTSSGAEPGFRGLVAEVRIWDAELSPLQLAAGIRQGPDDGGEHDGEGDGGGEGDEHEGGEQGHSGRGHGGQEGLLAWWRFERPGRGRLRDVVGGHRARPLGERQPRPRLVNLRIGPGRYYVGGVRCERPEEIAYDEQPGAAPLPSRGRHLVYLEAWEETVSAAQDPRLLEVALGGLDTSVRTRIATRVRVAELDADDTPGEHDVAPAELDADHAPAGHAPTGRLAARHEGAPVPANRLYRVEVHAGGVIPAAVGGGDLLLATDPASRSERDGPGERGSAPAPTFKWSRGNGAELFAIVPGSGGRKTAEVLPARWLTPLAAGDVVEPLGEQTSLDDPAPALLALVEGPDETGTIHLSGRLPAGTTLLRRWDHVPEEDARGAIAGDVRWRELEDGIEMRATPGGYRRGDFWWIVARQELGSIQWPSEGGQPLALEPDGVERRTAPLALLRLGHHGVEVEDLRTIGAAAAFGVEPEDAPDVDLAAGAEQGRAAGEPEDGKQGETHRGDHAFGDQEEGEASGEEDEATRAGTGEIPGPVTVELGKPRESPGWRLLSMLEELQAGLEAVASTAEDLVLATTEELLAVHPGSGTVRWRVELPERRTGFSLQVLAGSLLLVGGRAHRERAEGRVTALEAGGGWRECARLPGSREGVAIAVVDDALHALGGLGGGLFHRQGAGHHLYEAEHDRWRRAGARLPSRVAQAAALAVDGRLWLVGGVERDGATARGVNQSLRRDGRSWRAEPAVPGPRHVLGACAHEGRVVALVEDREGERPPSTAIYDPTTATWQALAPLPSALGRPLVVEHHGRLLLAGLTPTGISLYESTLVGHSRRR